MDPSRIILIKLFNVENTSFQKRICVRHYQYLNPKFLLPLKIHLETYQVSIDPHILQHCGSLESLIKVKIRAKPQINKEVLEKESNTEGSSQELSGEGLRKD